MTCPGCGQATAFPEERGRTLVGLCGVVRSERASYFCRRCGQGLCPFDAAAGIGPHQRTPAAEPLTVLAGAVADSFEKGADLLREMAGRSVSESTNPRAREDAGRDVGERLGRGETFASATAWRWGRDARGRSVASVRIDATGTRPQGPGGAQAEGRTASVGAVYDPPPVEWLRRPGRSPPRVQARYVSGLYPLAEMGPLLRRQAARVGRGAAQVGVALTDGGNGLESFVQGNFKRADRMVILDFYQPTGYLKALAKAARPHDEAGAEAWTQQGRRLLKEEGGAATRAVVREWPWPARKSTAWRTQGEKEEESFGANLHRMEHPEYLAEGGHIGSGVVESACKTVVGQRLKGAGKRWGEDGTQALRPCVRFTGVRKGKGRRMGNAEPRTAHLCSNKSDAYTPKRQRGDAPLRWRFWLVFSLYPRSRTLNILQR